MITNRGSIRNADIYRLSLIQILGRTLSLEPNQYHGYKSEWEGLYPQESYRKLYVLHPYLPERRCLMDIREYVESKVLPNLSKDIIVHNLETIKEINYRKALISVSYDLNFKSMSKRIRFNISIYTHQLDSNKSSI